MAMCSPIVADQLHIQAVWGSGFLIIEFIIPNGPSHWGSVFLVVGNVLIESHFLGMVGFVLGTNIKL